VAGDIDGLFLVRSGKIATPGDKSDQETSSAGRLVRHHRRGAAGVVEARVRLVDLLNAMPMLEANLVHANAQHARIVEAILAGNPDEARSAMDEHAEGSAALLRGFLGHGQASSRKLALRLDLDLRRGPGDPGGRAVESGNLSVNSHSSVRYWTPFGGFKQSGLGRELGPDAPDAFTETKNVFISTQE
jgi:Aldehyde dehydrogenase family/FCD domain